MKYNWETERALLGGLMLEPALIADVLERLRPEDFHKAAHGRLFALLAEMVEKSNDLDIRLVMDEIGRRGDWDAYGGAAYVAGLPNECPAPHNAPLYAERVREHAVRRNLVTAATAIIEDVKKGEKDLTTLLDDAERSVFELSQLSGTRDWVSLAEVLDDEYLRIQKRAETPGDVTGLPTGFTFLDRLLAGLQPGNLVIVAARPGMGKTSFALNIANAVVQRSGLAVGVFTLEMSRGELVTRMLCSQARVDATRVKTGRLDREDWRRLNDAVEFLHPLPMAIDDGGDLTVHALRSKARRLRSEHPNLGLLVVDYLQLMKGSGGPKDSREQQISAISRGLKMLAKELQIPIIALSQLNRGVDARTDKRPVMSDLRESGAIEQDADVILFIYRDEFYNQDSPKKGVATIIVGKHRSGPTGEVDLAFLGEFTLFQNLARGDEGSDGYM
jgi:replicative DNA helicase